MRIAIVFPVLILSLLSCKQKPYQIMDVENPEYSANTIFNSYEDMLSPKFDTLRIIYQLDTIFHGEKDEMKRILLLRNWIKEVISINDFAVNWYYPGEGFAQGILDAALEDQGFHCGHFMIVQNAVMNAYGYVTRCIGSGPGVKGGPDYHHGSNEIWSNKYQKWFLSDAKYNHHFEKDGIPLSALEVRDEYIKNKAADIEMVLGPDKTPIDFYNLADKNGVLQKLPRKYYAQAYTWIEFERSNNRFTVWPDFVDGYNMYQDEYFKKHTWIWEGEPHWTYGTRYMNLVTDRNAIEWTPNTIESKVVIEENKMRIELTSSTPNFKAYQMKLMNDGDWKYITNVVEIPLQRDKNEITFRVINMGDVAGPLHKVIINR